MPDRRTAVGGFVPARGSERSLPEWQHTAPAKNPKILVQKYVLTATEVGSSIRAPLPTTGASIMVTVIIPEEIFLMPGIAVTFKSARNLKASNELPKAAANSEQAIIPSPFVSAGRIWMPTITDN